MPRGRTGPWYVGICLAIALSNISISPEAGAQTSTGPFPKSSVSQGSDSANGVRQGKTADQNFDLQPGEDPENRLLTPFLKHVVADQKQFWTTPTRFRIQDLKWAVPFVGVTAGFIASDQWWSKQVPNTPNQLNRSLNISDYTTYSLIGISGGSFLLGQITNNDHMKEAGLLSGEAAINSTGITYLFKEITQRQRPLDGNGNGNFFSGGSSFPSEHSAIAWSIASVMAHEYPGTLSQIAAYAAASAVTVTRVTARQHFPADAIVGSALGWYFGRQVYRAHHDPEVGGTGWGDVFEEKIEGTRDPAYMASPYVPVDSWIYPLFDRLAALGYAHGYADLRPWTRMECARLLVEDLEEQFPANTSGAKETSAIHEALANEFRDEIARLDGSPNVGATLESLYTRGTEIAGPPLRDGFHFGQTVINDSGRPYWSGFNNVSGVTVRAVAGPLAVFVRGEYQHAPAAPSESPDVLKALAAVDMVPFLPLNAIPQIDRFRLLESTVALKTGSVQLTFGLQDLWLGPTASGPLLYSNNAEPIPMFRVDTVSPYEIPLLSRLLGPARSEFFLGRLSGQQWIQAPNFYGPSIPSQPWLDGTKISFHPTPDLEFSLGFTAQFGGTGNPFTWHNFLATFYQHKATTSPAKRLSQFDFTYRVPGLRKWLTLYTDSMVIDEYSPLGSTRPQINPGIYLPQLPKLPKMELRLEGITTDLNIPSFFLNGAVYWDFRYRSGYTNNGNLLGSWIGRRGRGEQAWCTYSFSPKDRIQLGYRHNNVDQGFIPGGGQQQDISLRTDFRIRPNFGVSTNVQYESWRFPLLATTAQTNVTGSVELTFRPNWNWKKP